MDILMLGDNHGDIENTLNYVEKLNEFKFDVIVYSGDLTDSFAAIPKGFTQESIARILIEELRSLKKPIVAVPGNNDTYDVINLLEKEAVTIHGRGKTIDGVGFYGFGGAKTPFGTAYEPSDEELRMGLEKGSKHISNTGRKVLVTHNPAYGTRLDITQTGMHVGSEIIRKFIERERPNVAVSAHIHEAKGVDKIGDSFLINAGKFSEGYFGLVNISNNAVRGKVLNLVD